MSERLEWHRSQKHRLLLVSASLDAYLQPFGRCLGFDAVLATRLEIGPDGRLTGRLDGPNCRGREKATRVGAWLATNLNGTASQLWAYGDSAGDRELLQMADYPQRVRRRGPRP
jgi:HAD superfamily hydrolase (TIGR01490 family)